jgi:hypothetical protein
VLRDCGRVLSIDGRNVKALYRSAKACLAIERIEEAEDAIDRALTIEISSLLQTLKSDIMKRKDVIHSRELEHQGKAARKRDEEQALKDALKVSSETTITNVSLMGFELSRPLIPRI